MGQHKTNPVAIAAKNGEFPPKEKPKLSKRQRDALMYKIVEDRSGITTIKRAIGGGYYG